MYIQLIISSCAWASFQSPKLKVLQRVFHIQTSLMPPTINQEILNFLCWQCNQVFKVQTTAVLFTCPNSCKSLTSGAYADPDYWELFMMPSFRWDDLYSNRRERPLHSQSEIGLFVSLLSWLLCHIQGRGDENVHWEKQGHMKPQNSSRREEAWYKKLYNSIC